MNREEENQLILIASRWEAVCAALDGKELSDSMLSFPEVRKAYDLYTSSQQSNSAKCIHEWIGLYGHHAVYECKKCGKLRR
jgi:hypothetical protein